MATSALPSSRQRHDRNGTQLKRLLIASDYPLTRAGLIATLRDEPGVQVCGEAKSCEEVFAALEERCRRTVVPGTRSAFEGELHRPPMLADAAPQRAMLARLVAIAARHGLAPLQGLETGGGSDANLTAEAGIPSVDGLGVIGGAIHTKREWGFRRSLPQRAALTGAILLDLAARPLEL